MWIIPLGTKCVTTQGLLAGCCDKADRATVCTNGRASPGKHWRHTVSWSSLSFHCWPHSGPEVGWKLMEFRQAVLPTPVCRELHAWLKRALHMFLGLGSHSISCFHKSDSFPEVEAFTKAMNKHTPTGEKGRGVLGKGTAYAQAWKHGQTLLRALRLFWRIQFFILSDLSPPFNLLKLSFDVPWL